MFKELTSKFLKMAKKTIKKVSQKPEKRQQNFFSNFYVILLSIFIVITSFYVFEYLQNYEIQIKSKNEIKAEEMRMQGNAKVDDKNSTMIEKPKRPKYWFYMARQYMWIFFSIDNVLRRMGLEKIEMEIKQGENFGKN